MFEDQTHNLPCRLLLTVANEGSKATQESWLAWSSDTSTLRRSVFILANAAGNHEEALQLIYHSKPTLCSVKKSLRWRRIQQSYFLTPELASEMTAVRGDAPPEVPRALCNLLSMTRLCYPRLIYIPLQVTPDGVPLPRLTTPSWARIYNQPEQ